MSLLVMDRLSFGVFSVDRVAGRILCCSTILPVESFLGIFIALISLSLFGWAFKHTATGRFARSIMQQNNSIIYEVFFNQLFSLIVNI